MQLAFVAFVMAVLGTSSYFAWTLANAGGWAFFALVSVPVIVVAALAIVKMHRDGELASLVRPAWGDFTRGFFGALVLFLAAYAFTKMIAPAGSPRESWYARIYLQLGHPGVLRAHAMLVAVGIIVTAAAEEVVWRGLVTTLFAERFGSRFAWIFSAIAYAAAHVPTMWALSDPVAGLNPVLPLGALGLGLVLGVVVRTFDGLPPAIVAHALFDWCVVMMFRLWGTSI